MLTHAEHAHEYDTSQLAPADPGLDARLAATDAEMTLRLETAALRHAVDALTPETPSERAYDLAVTAAAVTDAEVRHAPPVAACLRRAAQRLEVDGWCQHTTRSGDARCLLGAIQDAATSAAEAASAAALLLDVIRQRRPTAASVAEYNDSAPPGAVSSALEGAAHAALARGL